MTWDDCIGSRLKTVNTCVRQVQMISTSICEVCIICKERSTCIFSQTYRQWTCHLRSDSDPTIEVVKTDQKFGQAGFGKRHFQCQIPSPQSFTEVPVLETCMDLSTPKWKGI